MAYEVNFALLGQPVDIGTAVATGYERGRAMRMQAQQDSAFAMLARDPNSAEARALLTASGRPDLARQFRQWGKEDRNEEFRLRALGVPSAFGSSPAPAASASPAPAAFPAANAPAAPAGTPPAIGTPAPAPVSPATPSAPPAASGGRMQLDQNVMQQWFAADPAGAREFLTAWNGLTDAQQAIATQRYSAAIPVLTTALSRPYAERRALIQSQAADLMANGWSREELDRFDPTDTNVQLAVRRGLPLAQQRDFFSASEAGPGTVGRNRFSNDVLFANPTAPGTQSSYDANGNEILITTQGTPAIGPGANLFGAGASGGTVAPAAPQVGEVRRGYRFKGGDPANPQSWEQVGGTATSDEAPAFRPAPGGAASGRRNFP